MPSTKQTRSGSKRTGANAEGGTIEKGQSKSARRKAGSQPPGGVESMDETERDTPERQKVRATIAPQTGGKRGPEE